MMESDCFKGEAKAVIPIVTAGFQSSSHIPFLRATLNSQISGLENLSNEMAGFSGITETEKQILRQKLLNQYSPHTSKFMVNDLDDFVEHQLGFLTEEKHAFIRKFSTSYMNLAVPIVLLSSSLAEALINSIVATGLIMTGRSQLFSMFDKMDIREKWRLGPTLIDNSIKLDNGSHHFGKLKELVTLRNAFTHSKIDIKSSDESASIAGTSDRKIDLNDQGKNLLVDFSLLPDALFDLVIESVEDQTARFHLVGSSFRFSV